jgi:hypothetical protein
MKNEGYYTATYRIKFNKSDEDVMCKLFEQTSQLKYTINNKLNNIYKYAIESKAYKKIDKDYADVKKHNICNDNVISCILKEFSHLKNFLQPFEKI